ncbi:MAG: DUF2797 domain-containing protein [Natronomonas sp.]
MQVVGYDIGVPDRDPVLLVGTDGAVRRESLTAGTTLGYSLGARRCAGVVDGETHRPCDDADAPFCAAHDTTWICARCTGTCLKAEMDCHQEHAIYLAAFAPDRFKVGVTKRDPSIRLREQGADRGAVLRRVSDGRIAREIEAEIASDPAGPPDSVRVDRKMAGLGRRFDERAWKRLLDRYEHEKIHRFEYGLDLTAAPVPATLLSGTVRGTKGRILLLDRGDGTYAVDMRDLVGYELSEGTESRELQSNLGAFG